MQVCDKNGYMSVNVCFCIIDWVTELWNHGFIDAPLIRSDLNDGLLDNTDLSNKLAKLHDLLLPWALNHQHPSAQSKPKIKMWFHCLY